MSFMKGFGDGFSKSFEQAASKRADKEAEVMRYTFQNYLDRRKVKEEREAEEAKNISTAKKLTSLYGAPEDAYHTVKSMIEAGMDTKDIVKEIRTGKWSERAVDNPVVKAETEASGMAAPAPNTSPETPSDPWTSIKSKLLGPRRNPQDKAFGQISEITGQSREEIDQTMAPSAPTPEPESRIQFTPAPLPVEPDPINTPDDAMLEVNAARAALEDDPENPDLIERYTAAQERVKTFDQDNASDWDRDRKRKEVEAKEAAVLKAQTEPDPYNTRFEASKLLADMKRLDAAGSTPTTKRNVEIAEERLQLVEQAEVLDAEVKARADAAAKGLAPVGGLRFKQRDPETGQNIYTRLVQRDGKWYKRNSDKTVEPVNIDEYDEVTDDELKDGIALANNYAKPGEGYLKRKSALVAVAKDFNAMGVIVKATKGQVLAGTTMKAVGLAVDVVQNLHAAASILTFEAGQQGEVPEGKVNELEAEIDQKIINLGPNITDLNTARALFDAKAKILAYRLGTIYGQDGRNMSDKDRAVFEVLAQGGYTPEQFYELAGSLVFSEIDGLKREEKDLTEQNVQLQTYENMYGGLPFKKIFSWDDEVSKDKDLQGAMELFDKHVKKDKLRKAKEGANPEEGAKRTEPYDGIPVMTSPEEAAKLPSGTQFQVKMPDGTYTVKVRP